MTTPNKPPYRVGDVIRHKTLDEEWVVGYVDSTHIHCLGWPHTLAPFADVELVEAATDEGHLSWLRTIAASPGGDIRHTGAREMLRRMGQE